MTGRVLHLIVLTWLVHILCAWKSGLCNRLCKPVLNDHTHDNTRSELALGGGGKGETGTNYRGPGPVHVSYVFICL